MKKTAIILICIFFAACHLAGCSNKKPSASRKYTSSRAAVVSDPVLNTNITEKGDDIIHYSSYNGRETTVTYHFNGEVLESATIKMVCITAEDADAQYENYEKINEKTTKPIYSDISREDLTITLKYTAFGMSEFKDFNKEELKSYLNDLVLLR